MDWYHVAYPPNTQALKKCLAYSSFFLPKPLAKGPPVDNCNLGTRNHQHTSLGFVQRNIYSIGNSPDLLENIFAQCKDIYLQDIVIVVQF